MFCCFSFCFCVDRYAYLTRGCAFLSDARFCFFVMPAILYRLLYETSVSFFSFSFTHRTEPLSIIGHIRGKKNLPTAIRQNGRGYSGGILVADYNQSPKRGVDCGIRAPAFWSDTWRWSNYFEYYTTGPMEVKFNLTLGSTWLWLYPSTTVLRLFRLRSFSSILRSSPGALLSTNRTAEFRFYDSSRFRKKAGDAKFRFYHVFRVGKVYRI